MSLGIRLGLWLLLIAAPARDDAAPKDGAARSGPPAKPAEAKAAEAKSSDAVARRGGSRTAA